MYVGSVYDNKMKNPQIPQQKRERMYIYICTGQDRDIVF